MKYLVWFIFFGLILLSACTSAQPAPANSPVATATTPREFVSPLTVPTLPAAVPTNTAAHAEPPSTQQEIPIQPKALETHIIEDLAKRLDISSAEISLISAEADEFPGANFGCPTVEKAETGGASPAFVTAKEFVLEAHGLRYHYRGRGNQSVFCFAEE